MFWKSWVSNNAINTPVSSGIDFIDSYECLCIEYTLANLGKLHLGNADVPLRAANARSTKRSSDDLVAEANP
jgi:hypothetical protein